MRVYFEGVRGLVQSRTKLAIFCALVIWRERASKSRSTHASASINPLSPSQFVSIQILLKLSKQNKLFGNENKVNDHTQQFI